MTNSLYQCLSPNDISRARALSLSAFVPPNRKEVLFVRTQEVRVNNPMQAILHWSSGSNKHKFMHTMRTHTHALQKMFALLCKTQLSYLGGEGMLICYARHLIYTILHIV